MTGTAATWADSKEAWFERVHDAVLPSGMHVTFRDLSLAELALLEELPGELLELVVEEWAAPGAMMSYAKEPFTKLNGKPTKKQADAAEAEVKNRLSRIADVNRALIAAALVEPKITAAELQRVPMPDLEMLSGFVNRTQIVDAAGRHVGVVRTDQFQVVLSAHGHGECAPGCSSCETARRGVSTIR